MIAGSSQLYFGTTVGKTFAFDNDTYSDDGNNIALRIRTKNYYPQPVDFSKQIKTVSIFSEEPQGTNFSISLDGGEYEYKGQIQGETDPDEFKIWKSATYFSLGLDEISTNNIKIKGFLLYYA
jgi:hypothetical protein